MPSDASAAAPAPTAAEGGRTVKVHEEELHPRKHPVQAGEARVRKDVVTEHRQIDVPVEREEIVVERRPVSGRAASSADIGAGQEIRVPVTEERVEVTKTPVVKEEVTVGKRKVKDTQRVSGDVRREEVHVERKGDVDIKGGGTGNRPG